MVTLPHTTPSVKPPKARSLGRSLSQRSASLASEGYRLLDHSRSRDVRAVLDARAFRVYRPEASVTPGEPLFYLIDLGLRSCTCTAFQRGLDRLASGARTCKHLESFPALCLEEANRAQACIDALPSPLRPDAKTKERRLFWKVWDFRAVADCWLERGR